MKSTTAVAALALASSAAAQNSSMSICDKYSSALLGSTSAADEYTLLKYLVNTAVIGNAALKKPDIPGKPFPTNITVPGILAANQTYNGATVNLLPYFDGGLASSNRGGMGGVAVNFLDDGGAVPLESNEPANGTSSNQYALLTHLYEYFGTALGCSGQTSNTTAFPAYSGQPSMYNVHRFMDLTVNEVGYFIEQVGLSALSFGVSAADATAVGNLLNSTFGFQCAAAATLIPASAGPQLNSICIAPDCPVAANASVASCPYAAPVVAGIANPALADGLGNSSNTYTASYSSSGAASTGPASTTGSMAPSSSSSPGTTSSSGGTAPVSTGAAADVKAVSSWAAAFLAAFAFAL